jgi:hypothetical protein
MRYHLGRHRAIGFGISSAVVLPAPDRPANRGVKPPLSLVPHSVLLLFSNILYIVLGGNQ